MDLCLCYMCWGCSFVLSLFSLAPLPQFQIAHSCVGPSGGRDRWKITFPFYGRANQKAAEEACEFVEIHRKATR